MSTHPKETLESGKADDAVVAVDRVTSERPRATESEAVHLAMRSPGTGLRELSARLERAAECHEGNAACGAVSTSVTDLRYHAALLREVIAALLSSGEAGQTEEGEADTRVGAHKVTTGDNPTAASTEAIRALFIPIRAEFYDAFGSGTKTDELRRYGPRWNERTCAVGRRVVLSCGYGRQARMMGRIVRFKKQHATTFGSTYKASIERIYGTLDLDIACIGIEIIGGASPSEAAV